LVDYRVAPEHPHPTPVDNCYRALCWLANNGSELGVDPKRIAVMGESAGGGLAAGVALMARDRGGPVLAQQLLIYAMLDDRTIGPDPQLPPEYLVFGYDDNQTGWGRCSVRRIAATTCRRMPRRRARPIFPASPRPTSMWAS